MTGRVLGWVLVLAIAGAASLAGPLAGQEKKEEKKDKEKKVEPPVVGKLVQKVFEREAPTKVRYDYLLYLPADYGKEKKAWPVVLFLHGLGDKIARLKRGGLPRQIEQKKEARFILVAPENPVKGWSTTGVNALLDDVVSKHDTDRDRLYVTGLSMGGFGTWALAAAYPDKFAAIVPICGGGNPTSARKIKDLPIWAFHGAKDDIVPAARTDAMIKALKAAGAEKVKYTLYPDAKHDSWTRTYRNDEVWDWLLKQKRGAKKE